VSTHFRSLTRRNADHEAQVAFVHETYRGVIGRMIPLVRRVDLRTSESPSDTVDLLFVQAVHTELRLARDQAVRAAQTGFIPPKPSKDLGTGPHCEIGDVDAHGGAQITWQSTVQPRAASRRRRTVRGKDTRTIEDAAVLEPVSDVFETISHCSAHGSGHR